MKIRLIKFPKSALEPNDQVDKQLRPYYLPVFGYLYRRKVEAGLSLLSKRYESIIEVGYGSGIILPTLLSIGSEVYGVDIDSDPLRTEELLWNLGVYVKLFKGNISEWELPGKRFDLVVAFSIFEHIRNPYNAMQQISELLKPGGILLVGMPRVDKIMTFLFSLIGYEAEGDHVTTYKDVINCSAPYFRLKTLSTFPRTFPKWASLYYNILFIKA